MLTFLLEKMTKLDDHTMCVEHGAFIAEPPYELEISHDIWGHSISESYIDVDLCGEIPQRRDIELDHVEIVESSIVVESQLIDFRGDLIAQDLDPDFGPEDRELTAPLQPDVYSIISGGHMASRRSLFASFMLHAFVMCLAAFAATTHAKGTYGSGGESVMVRFVAQEESVPVEETPASIDSAASAPSVAGKPDQHKKAETQEKKEQSETREKLNDSARMYVESESKVSDREEKETKKDEPQQETNPGDGPTNSVASLPSIASEERRILSAGGSDMEDFQSRILAAIRESIHFPKEALERKKHGETVVQFTVNRDGSISNLCVKRESGSNILDEAALAIIRKASKNFPSIPARLAADGVNYVVPILFKEKRSSSANN